MIECQKVSFAYDKHHFYFDFKIKAGETVAIVGESGAGKSTLFQLLSGFEYPKSGEIILNNINHTFNSPNLRPISLLFQEHNLFNHLTVWQNLALGIRPNLKINWTEQEKIKGLLKQMNLSNYSETYPENLSGGQKQRVGLARCLLRQRPILLLDEPFSAFDPHLRQEMFHLIKDLHQKEGFTLLLITHQLNEFPDFFSQIFTIKNGAYSQNNVIQ